MMVPIPFPANVVVFSRNTDQVQKIEFASDENNENPHRKQFDQKTSL